MRRGRRRLRQRNEWEKESVDSSSDSDIVLVSTTEEVRPSSQKVKADKTEKSREHSICTSADVDQTTYRCKVSESLRLGFSRKVQKLPQWQSQPVDKSMIERSKDKRLSDFRLKCLKGTDNAASGDAAIITSATLSSDGDAVVRCNNVNKVAAKTCQNLWSELYAPKTVDELCVNEKKVHEILNWLERTSSSSRVSQKRLLFLCGPPGSGKSTTVRCIARKLGLLIKEWKDNSAAGKIDFECKLRDDIWTPQTSRVDDFSDFMFRSSVYTALPVATTRHTATIGCKRRLPCIQQESLPVSTRQVVLVESWPQSRSKNNLMYEEQLKRIYQFVIDSTSSCHYPVVCIYSDIQGSKIDLEHLSRIFSREVMHSPLTTVIHINPVTTARLKKCLNYVAAQENCHYQLADFQNIIDSSNGDIRHALNMLQLLHTPNAAKHKVVPAVSLKKNKKKRTPSSTSESLSVFSLNARDLFLSDFHLIGKLLHGKMIEKKRTHQSMSISEANDISYNCFLDATAMPLDRILGLVHENSIPYFSLVEDLSIAMELMSLCEAMVANTYNGTNSYEVSKRLRDVAQAILTRVVAITNENPAPKAFRPIARTRTFSAKQRIVSRREEMFEATRGKNGLEYACTGDVFAFEVEPYLTIMDREGRFPSWQNSNWSLSATDTLSLKELDDEIENSDNDSSF